MTTNSWWLCLGCGAWQQVTSNCLRCSSPRVVPAKTVGSIDGRTGQKIDGSSVRVLIDIEARSDGAVRATRLHTDRLTPIRHDEALLVRLDNEVQVRFKESTANASMWSDLHAASRVHVIDAVDRLLRPRWPGKPRESEVPIDVSFRLLNLDPNRNEPDAELPWLEVVTLDAAVERAAKKLRPGDVKGNLYGSLLSLDDGGDRLRLGLRVPAEAVVKGMTLSPSGSPTKVLARFEESAFLARDVLTSVLDTRLPASVLWHLSPQHEAGTSSVELRAQLRGIEAKPIRVSVPCGDLGNRTRLVDVFLDLGSTTTKYIVRVGDQLSKPQVKRTAKLADEWSLPRYEKARLLSDITGAGWASWVAALLTSLRRYAALEHRGYLRCVHLTVPQSGRLDVAALSRAVASRSNAPTERSGLDTASICQLIDKAGVEAVGFALGHQVVVLTPEHEALALHYLAPLKVLHQAAASYHRSFSKREEERAYQTERRKDWDRKKAEQHDHDNSFFLYRWFSTRPAGPSGTRPSVSSSLASPADWMQRLRAHPELLDRVVLLDAGGLSMDIAALESSVLVQTCSKSDATCGGEAVSQEFARRLGVNNITSEDGTRQKARLGDQWTNPANVPGLPWDERFGRFGGRHQRAYREVTHTIYQQALTNLATAIAGRWKNARGARCTVLLTGGGSRNPHFQEVVADCLAGAGLEADVVDARGLQGLLDEARSFKHPLPALASTPVTLFSTVHGWALREVRGSERMAYDKYAVVGGLLSGAQRS